MARKLYVLGIFLMAGSIGVIGFQSMYYVIDGTWPAVRLQLLWVTLVGPMTEPQRPAMGRIWDWFGDTPVAAAGMALAYAVFLLSDTLRRR